MCLLFLAIDAHPNYRLIAAANRDEYFDRPTARMQPWAGTPEVIAGKDLEKGGTWFGVTRSGRWAAVTNYRDDAAPANGASRGVLVRDYLLSSDAPERFVHDLAAAADDYSGFNLIAGTLSHAVYFSNREHRVRVLRKGVYGLSNHLLDTPWPKVRDGKRSLTALMAREHLDTDSLFSILNDRLPAADRDLPTTRAGVEWERLLSSAFVSGTDYGTRSSTILLAGRNNRLELEERTYAPAAHRAPGTYSSVSYEFGIQQPRD